MTRLLIALLFAAPLIAQDAPPAEQAKAVLEKYRAERAEAAKAFAPADLAAADDLAARADAALQANNPAAAARLARDARWQLPFVPPNLPPHVARVLGVARLRHGDRVNALAYSPDGTKLASASRDGTVKLWDLGNGRELLTYRGHSEKVEPENEKLNVLKVPGAAFSPDGKVVASSGGKEIHVWDAATGKLLHTLAGHTQPIRGLAFASDPNTLVSGGDDRRVIVWDVAKEKPLVTFPEQAQRVEGVAVGGKGKLIATINAAGEMTVYPLGGDKKDKLLSVPAATDGGQIGLGVAFAGDGGSVLVCGGDSKAKLIAGPDPAGTAPGSGTAVRSYVGHSDKLNALGATPDGKLLVTGGNDKTVRVWEVGTGKPLWTFQGHTEKVTAIAVRPDGKQAASGSEDGSVRVWPLSATDEHRASTEATDALWTVAVSPDGKRVAAAGADRTVRVYDAAGKVEKTLTGHKGAVPAVAFVGNGSLASVSGDKLVKVWDLGSGSPNDLKGHAAAVLAVAADEAGKLLVSGSVDKSVKGWDPTAGTVLWTWEGKSAVCTVAVRKDGKRVAVGTADGWLTVLDVGDGAAKVVGTVSAHGNGVAGVAFHPDGSKVATAGGDGMIRVWAIPDAGPPTQVGKLDPPSRTGAPASLAPVTAVAYSSDGRLLASAGADAVTRVWDAQTGTELRGFRGHTDWVTAVAFAPDGRAVISAGVDKAVRVFELARQETAAAAGHVLPVRCVAVSRDGRFAATGAEDRTVKVWDLTTGKEVATLTGAAEPVNAIGFAGPNEVLATGDDGRVRWWTVSPAREVRTAPTGKAFNMAVTADGKAAVVWTRKGEKHTGFEVFGPDGAALTVVNEKGRDITCATLSADGTLGVSGDESGGLWVWDLTTKDRVGGNWPLFTKAVADLALTPDKKTLIAIDTAGTVKVADLAKRAAGEAIKAVTGEVAGVVASPAGDRFATLSAAGEVKVWDLGGKELRAWKLPIPPAAAAFTPDGKKLVTGNKDGTAYVLDLP